MKYKVSNKIQNIFSIVSVRQKYKVGKLRLTQKYKNSPKRFIIGGLAMLMLFSASVSTLEYFVKNRVKYELSQSAKTLLPEAQTKYNGLFEYDAENTAIKFNANYTPDSEGTTGSSPAKFTATFHEDAKKGIDVTDPVNKVTMTLKPMFSLKKPVQKDNQIMYQVRGEEAVKVVSLSVAGYKEDVIVEEFIKEDLAFEYELVLPDGVEARIESDGSIGIYGADPYLLGNVTATTEADQETLAKARQNADKKTLLFSSPAPFIKEFQDKKSSAKAWYAIDGNTLTIHTSDMSTANYPVSVDPSIYVNTAQRLMIGNNETNTDFDVDNELIQKSQTTGARIDAWEENLDLSTGTWDNGVAAAGGYIYSAGGRTSTTKPYVVSSQASVQATNSSTFTMSMPTSRPAGDLYVAMMCHDGTGTVSTVPSGWTKVSATDTDEVDAWYKIGTDAGGGNEAASYAWGGITEQWAGTIVRIKGFNSGDPIAGTPGTTNTTGTPTFPATTPDANATLVLRAIGIDDDDPTERTWVPTGHTKIHSATTSTDTGSCGFAAAHLNVPPASGVSSGSAALLQTTLSGTYGGISVAINPGTTASANLTSVNWAKFNTTSQAIESPNPGDGACSVWCTDTDYDLPESRRGASVIAYNGYLYVIGGSDGTNYESTVLIAKLGANGEPQLWHPTGGSAVFWYQDTGLNGGTARAYHSAYAYNNRMYIVGGDTNTTANSGASTTVEIADILPNGRLGSWSSGTALPTTSYGHTVHIYNDVMYLLGGNNNGTMLAATYYTKINTNGTLNSWTSTNTFTTARGTMGGSYSTVWGAYMYIAGGCTTVNASGYCTAYATDTQIASINADGTLAPWGSISTLENQRVGYTFIGWQNALYRVGGCAVQNTSTGECTTNLADVDYGVINPSGEVSTVNVSTASGAGTCTGGTPYNCNIPDPGDDANEGGNLLSMTAIMNGYLYHIGGCVDLDCNGTDDDHGDGDDLDASGNVSYASIGSDGRLTAPGSCAGSSYGAWCIDATNRLNTTDGVAAAGVATFNGRIYIVGGVDGDGHTGTIYYNDFSATTGAPNGAWETNDLTTAGVAQDVAYTYAYARANPASAGSTPGNLYIFGGCGDGIGTGLSCEAVAGSNEYVNEVYKCNISTTGSVSGCTTTGQTQIDSDPDTGGSQGLGIHSGTVNANYIYLVGGYSETEPDKDEVLVAKFDNSNNVVEADGAGTANWTESLQNLNVGRRRGFSFGYNGHIYSIGGYDDDGGATTILPYIEWAKMNVSSGDVDDFVTSSIQITQRWGLSVVVSNSYAYVFGGCDAGASPSSCTSFLPTVQTFQLYNNESGAVNDFTAQSDDEFSAADDRWGASSAIYTDPATNQSYIYVAGGCVSATDCTDATNSTQYATISATDGTIGTWTAGGNLPADVAWGALQVAGSGSSFSLYYMGGQNDTATNEQTAVYYTTAISSGNPTWGTAANALPGARTKFGSAVWDNRLYVVGGLDGSAAVSSTVYVSPQLDSGGDIGSAWSSTTAFNVARTGAAVTAYANNLYLFGGFDGTNYLNDSQFTQINSDGTVDAWTYSTSLPGALRDAQAVSANGYLYLVGGRSAASTCLPNTIISPIVANTTITTGNNPSGVGEWYETNVRYASDRYGAAASYHKGKLYTMGGGCAAPIDCSTASICNYYSTVKSQPQVAKYSRLIDTDSDVFPTYWLLNGLDNSIGARWNVRYRSMNDIDGVPTDCGSADMSTWGQETNFGEATLGSVEDYNPLDGSGADLGCARYFYFFIDIDASKTFGYPEDVARGPTIDDLTLFFTADPSKRLKHGKTFTGGLKQPLDTPPTP